MIRAFLAAVMLAAFVPGSRAEEAAVRLSSRVAALYRLTDAMLEARYQARMKTVEHPEICLGAHSGNFVAPERLPWLEAYAAQLSASANPTGALRFPAHAAE